MKKLWITYAWGDNTSGDVDFVAQELGNANVQIKLDRWNLVAGQRLWTQIENFIVAPTESDAWLLIASGKSLASEPCKEEFAYALDRALNSRGQTFPVIALFLGPVDHSLIPAGIRTRLFVSITDPDWKERIVAATEGRAHQSNRQTILPYHIQVHKNQPGTHSFAIEVRPRAGVWAPFIAGMPVGEKAKVEPTIMLAPRDMPTFNGMLTNRGEGVSADGVNFLMIAGNPATPNESYYIWCKSMPTQLIFGANRNEGPHFIVTF